MPHSKILSFNLIFLLLISSNSILAKDSNYDFRIYDNKDGFNSPEVICVFADAKSYLWIGGVDGLTKYDGATFFNYNKIE
jgi:ligand-binding sensor domain-containing protein